MVIPVANDVEFECAEEAHSFSQVPCCLHMKVERLGRGINRTPGAQRGLLGGASEKGMG